MDVLRHWREAEQLPRCQHCPNLADERSFMCEDCAGKADEEVESLRQQAVEAMTVARSALRRRMSSDATLDEPYDEDMADAIRRLDAALGGQ